VKTAGESNTRPDLRYPPHNDAAYNKVVRGVLAGRAAASSERTAALGAGEIALVMNPKQGLEKLLMAPWRIGTTKELVRKSHAEGDDMEDEEAVAAEEEELPGFVSTSVLIAYSQDSINNRSKLQRNCVGIMKQYLRVEYTLLSSRFAKSSPPDVFRPSAHAGAIWGMTLLVVAFLYIGDDIFFTLETSLQIRRQQRS